jgi:hypothetical protein
VIAALALALAAEGVSYVDASLELNEDLLGHEFVDVDGDGAPELVLAVKLRRGGRELRLHRIAGVRVEPEPYVRVPVLRDVLAYGFADVRAEPGRELLFLTRGGVHSYSTTREGLRDNVARLIESELIYDVPDARALPFWRYVLPGEGGDIVLVPSFLGLELWGPPPHGEAGAGYVRRCTLGSRSTSFRRLGGDEERRGEARVDLEGNLGLLYHDSFQDDPTPDPIDFLGDSRAVRAPALADVDGDGRLDLVTWQSSKLSLHLDRGQGIPAEPTRVEESPEYLQGKGDGGDTELSLVDLDGDGDLDLLVELRSGGDGFENAEYTLMPLIHEDGRMFPKEPSQLLRFEAAVLRVEVVDIDGDGRPDLAVRQFELPDMLETVKGLEFELTYLLYLGEEGPRPFGRKPALRRAERFDEDSVAAAAANRDLSMDCDGDGTPDLVEVDLAGYVAIRRLKLESGFFSGESWELDEAPWKRFEVRGDIESLEVLDLNGDGLGDIVSSGDRTLAILLSMDPRRRR